MTHIAKVLNNRTETLALFFWYCSTSQGDDTALFVDLVRAYERVKEESHDDWDEYFADMKLISKALQSANACCCLQANKSWIYYIGTSS